MKVAVSVSLGSNARDHEASIRILGETVVIRREGTNGDIKLAQKKMREYDGKVDALGVGGTDLYLRVADRYYKLHGSWKMIKQVKHTPVVDGNGLKTTLESQLASFLEEHFDLLNEEKKVLVTSAVDRYGMAKSFVQAGFDTIMGDFIFALGIPIKIRTLTGVRRLARMLLPIVGRLPLSMIYPTGEKQLQNTPKHKKLFEWATIIAGDFHYIRRYAPLDLSGKIIVTNTTTLDDLEFLKERGVTHVITSTPMLDGRTFGTNALEAGITAATGKGRPLSDQELFEVVREEKLKPTLHRL